MNKIRITIYILTIGILLSLLSLLFYYSNNIGEEERIDKDESKIKKKYAILMGYSKYVTLDDRKLVIPILFQYLYTKQFEDYLLIYYEYENHNGVSCTSSTNNPRHPSWCKILAINHTLYLEDIHVETMLWLDSDAIIDTNLTLPQLIQEYTNNNFYQNKEAYEDCDVYISPDDRNNLYDRPCAGVVFLKNNNASKKFIKYWWEYDDYELKFDLIHIWEQIVVQKEFQTNRNIILLNMSSVEPFPWNIPILHFTHQYFNQNFQHLEDIMSMKTSNQSLLLQQMMQDAKKDSSHFRHYKMTLDNKIQRVYY
eukprot:TRINITY_DN2785_c0_g2_i1.p1 TRINITY_DN2785_c0_g2~~TRINITY_DN2785_c0_g2_i1.p1  ORF type:complete len:310 (-),score=44.23 TRINITY_DN2785_c0_g2_i1:173-1102(-)